MLRVCRVVGHGDSYARRITLHPFLSFLFSHTPNNSGSLMLSTMYNIRVGNSWLMSNAGC